MQYCHVSEAAYPDPPDPDRAAALCDGCIREWQAADERPRTPLHRDVQMVRGITYFTEGVALLADRVTGGLTVL
ncbi:hypothetical protein [Amycolatopsis thermophila]|uniref:Uncharacterized protein n=1 Tax=Amycolatopsis thermophila TaxID=206084 RepID=A0ABU0F2J4_9PSEU|nr:hypothetical protein [Amycolatopsis thermophila]MDQ0381396.1 hypothetical protein [Amycolatopsis thermophila]